MNSELNKTVHYILTGSWSLTEFENQVQIKKYSQLTDCTHIHTQIISCLPLYTDHCLQYKLLKVKNKN